MCLPDQQLNILLLHCPLCLLSTRPSSSGRNEPQPEACLCCLGAELCRQGFRLLFMREYGKGLCPIYSGTMNKSFCK